MKITFPSGLRAKILLPALLGFFVLCYWAGRHDALRVLRSYMSGHSGGCTLAESFDSASVSMTQIAATNRMKAGRRPLRHDPAGYDLINTPRGPFWTETRGGGFLEYDLAEQERHIYGEGETGVHPGDIVLDGGANIGVFAREALARGAKLVVAIEPAPENLECLRRNLATEIAAGRVLVYPKGIWDAEQTLAFKLDPDNAAADGVEPIVTSSTGFKEIQVAVTTIDRLVAELRLPRVDFIKMDIEGAEQRAIAGARATIQHFRPRMALCLYHKPGDGAAIPKAVLACVPGYRTSIQCICGSGWIGPQVAHFF